MHRYRIAGLAALMALGAALMPLAASAANCTTQYVGGNAYTNCYGNGYNSNFTTQYVGGNAYTTGYDNYGGSYSSTTQYVGGNAYTSGGWSGSSAQPSRYSGGYPYP